MKTNSQKKRINIALLCSGSLLFHSIQNNFQLGRENNRILSLLTYQVLPERVIFISFTPQQCGGLKESGQM